jgi:hypothetical protein
MPGDISEARQKSFGSLIPAGYAPTAIQPTYHFQKQVPLNYFSLGSVLSYASALANYHLREMHEGVGAATQTAEEAGISAKEADAGARGWASRAGREFTKGQQILAEQSEIFKGIASSEALVTHASTMREYEQQSLDSNESGEGHMDRMIATHDDLTTRLLGTIGDPQQRQQLKGYLNRLGVDRSGQWFHDENVRKLQYAANKIQENENQVATQLSKGISLEDAFLMIAPVYSALPRSLGPKRDELIADSQSKLAHHSALVIALKNPINANAEIQRNPLYQKLLTPQQQFHITQVAYASLMQMAHENVKAEANMAADEASRAGTEMNSVVAAIGRGEYGYRDIMSDPRWQGQSGVQKHLTHVWKEYAEAAERQAIQSAGVEQTYRMLGNYTFLGDNAQQREWAQIVASTQFMDPQTGLVQNSLLTKEGESALKKGRLLLTYAERASAEFTAPLKELTSRITRAVRHGGIQDFYDGVYAYAHLKTERQSILGGLSQAEKIMLDRCVESVANNAPFGQMQKFCNGMMEPVSEELRKKIDADYRENNFLCPFRPEALVAALPILKGDIRILAAAREYHKQAMLYTGGDVSAADKMVVNEFRSVYQPTRVNGVVGGGIMKGAPESYIGVRNTLDGEHQRDIVASAMCYATREAASSAFQSYETQGTIAQRAVVEILPNKPGQKFNPCNIHTQGGTYFGCYWLEQYGWGMDVYRVKYTLLPAPAEAGGYTTLIKYVPATPTPENVARQTEHYNKVASDIEVGEGAYMTDSYGDFITVKAAEALRGYMNRIKEGHDMLIAEAAQATFGTKSPKAKK